jgi:hypothetical protein
MLKSVISLSLRYRDTDPAEVRPDRLEVLALIDLRIGGIARAE